MKKIWIGRFFVMLILSLVLAACDTGQAISTPPPATAVTTTIDTAVPPIANPTATPPVATPTIVIPTPEAEPSATPEPVTVTDVTASERPVFAVFKETAVESLPAIYHDPIASDLSNVVIPFILSEGQRARLAQDGIVVSPGVEKEFFTVYEQSRYNNLPTFVTSDSLLHIYHLLFDKVLRTAEKESFIPLLADLNQAMLSQTDTQYQALQGTEWEDAARRTVAFIGVGSQLLHANVQIPAYAADLVEAEIANIEDAAGIISSPVFPGLEFGEDYTQYIPRGHYTTSEELTAYFKSMMWYGRMTFRLKSNDPEVGKAETRAALLLVHALRTAQVNGQPALDAWIDLYNPTVFFVGRSDDLTAFQYLDVIDAIYGPDADLAAIADESKLPAFIETANQLPPPMILGLVISDADDVEDVTKGFRFMGQRFVPDAYIFRQLIYRNVGVPGNARMLPKGLDVMAAMGSDRAYTLLDEMGETSYENYPEQMVKMQTWVNGLTVEEWTETLYTAWLYAFHPLLEEPGDGYPQFMQSDAWLDKQLNASLGSWAELKHDTILYAKQVYAEMGGGGGSNAPTPLLAQGYVEPVPGFFARLSALTSMTLDGLDSRGLLNEQDGNSLERLLQLSDAFQLMAEKELRGEPLTDAEFRLIRYYGGELEHLTMAAADRDDADPNAQPIMDEEPQAAVIADVATAPDPDGDGAPNPVVLEEAIGRINEIYVVVPLITADGTIRLQVAKGGAFAYYEFPWPADDRLTDEKWRTMLDEGTAPPPPEWTASFFTPETEFSAYQKAVYKLQRSLGYAYWNLDAAGSLYNASEAVQSQFDASFADLRATEQYIVHQWLHASYRSFDRQSGTLAVVTARETWEDKLYSYAGQDGPGDSRGTEPVAERGPYTLDVTYTLEFKDDQWQITRVVYANEPPAWEN